MAEQPGSKVLLLADALGISEGAAPNIDTQAVLYGPGIARGESSPAAGQDVLMITEDTAQTGPSSFLVDGEPIGFFETSETPSEFYDFQAGTSETPPNAVGLKDFGMDTEPGTRTMYVFIFHSTETDEYCLGIWYYKEGDSATGGVRATVGNSAGNFPNPGTPLVADDPIGVGTDDIYSTNGDGDAFADHLIGSWDNGDGVMWEVNTGTYTLDFLIEPSQQNTSADQPNQVIFRGPEGNLKKDISGTNSFTFTIAFS